MNTLFSCKHMLNIISTNHFPFLLLILMPKCASPPAGNPQLWNDGPAAARVPHQPPTPTPTTAAAAHAAAAHAAAACHDDAHSGHQHATQYAHWGRCSYANAHGWYQPTAPAGQPAAVPLLGLQLRYRPALSSSSKLLQPLLLPSLPQPSSG